MKQTKTLLICGLLMIISFSLLAQGADTLRTKSYKLKSEAVVTRLERELTLTEKQAGQVQKLLEERFSALQKTSVTDRGRWESVNMPARQKLATILTTDQYKRYLELRQETQNQKQEFLKKNPGYTFSDEDKELDF